MCRLCLACSLVSELQRALRGPGAAAVPLLLGGEHQNHRRQCAQHSVLEAEGTRFSTAENCKVSCNDLGMYHSSLTLKNPACTLSEEYKGSPFSFRETITQRKPVMHLQIFREFCSIHKYHNHGYVINTWKSRLDQSDKKFQQYPRLILVQLKFPAAVH